MLLLALLSTVGVLADGWDTNLYKQIEQSIQAPVFRDKVYKPAVKPTNSAWKNQKAINRAIERASKAGGGKVVIPEGVYMTGAIRLLSDVNLVVSKGATLRFAYESALYPRVYTRCEGLDLYS